MRFALLLFFFILNTDAYSADWLELKLDEEEYQVFIDRDTTVLDEPIIEYWLKLEHKDLQKIPGSNMKFDKVLLHILIRCNEKTEALDQEKYFREGVLVKSIRKEKDELTWKPLETDSTNEFLMNKFCVAEENQEQTQE